LSIDRTYNEAELLHRIADGDQEAFTFFFRWYQKKLFTVCKMYLKVDALAEEALQEIFLKVWINRSKLREIKDLEAWTFILAKNFLIGTLEKWARDKMAEKSWSQQRLDEYSGEQASDMHYQQILKSAVHTLSARQQAVFLLSKEEQLTHKEIGERLSLSPLTVKTHLQRAMQQIRRYLTDHPEVFALFFSGIMNFL
jgi:RNA polymerase sigma factor (sigma-70 family)